MSAFVVDREHIDALLERAMAPSGYGGDRFHWYDRDAESWHELISYENAGEVGRMLWAENVKSVQYRYDDEPVSDLPGPAGLSDEEVDGYSYTTPARRLTIVQALKAISCYEYQSCEHPGWETSSAYGFCDALRHKLIGQLPGYDDAPWGVYQAASA